MTPKQLTYYFHSSIPVIHKTLLQSLCRENGTEQDLEANTSEYTDNLKVIALSGYQYIRYQCIHRHWSMSR